MLSNSLRTNVMVIDLSAVEILNEDLLGGKALNLAKLLSIGMPVPPCVVLPHHISIEDELNIKSLLNHGLFANSTHFAVRSSGVGEDSVQNSFAGIFDTYLDIEKNEILPYIHKVRESANSERSKKYSSHRDSKIKGMNVIIQQMVPALYAGVVFSKNPIENYDRIGLLEIVKGSGEQLVSGKVTPTSIRYNKLTHQFTVKQNGADTLDESVINELLEELLPLIKIIEEEYKYPVDVEWVYGTNKKMYILQARPITT